MTLLRRVYASDDALASAVRVLDDDFDRLHPIRCAPGGRAAAACYSGPLGAQDRIDALCKSSAQDAAAALAGSKADAHIAADDEAHTTSNKTTITVRPPPPVALLDDHATEFSSASRMGNTLTNRIVNRSIHGRAGSRRVEP